VAEVEFSKKHIRGKVDPKIGVEEEESGVARPRPAGTGAGVKEGNRKAWNGA